MNSKSFILNALHHGASDKIPIFYRGDLIINEYLLNHFGLTNIDTDYDILAKKLGADFYTGGVTFSDFHTFAPRYTGPDFGTYEDPNFFYTFGINSKVTEFNGKRMYISYFDEPRLQNCETVNDIKEYSFPDPSWFDFNFYKNILSEVDYTPADDIVPREDVFLGTLLYSSIFMISSYLRGMSRLLEDLVCNKKLAKYLIDRVGEICLEVSKENLKSIGNSIEMYGMWDDVAMQTGLMMHPDVWREYYKPWYKKIIDEAKKYNLIVMFHCCGSCVDIIPDFIDIGIDILDPVQTSARGMGLNELKREFGRDICFHGGLDIQQLLVQGSPDEIRKEVRKADDLFRDDGGIFFGPSHYITADTPLENVFAIYDGK